MLLATTHTLSGYEIVQVLGLVEGNVVQSKHIGRDIAAGIKSMFGGELRGYSELLTEARDKAKERMIDQAEQKGADAIVGLCYTTSEIGQGICEVLAYGTAVKLDRRPR
jgi:uncharacterized protein YbjQ (UPF0145 family)